MLIYVFYRMPMIPMPKNGQNDLESRCESSVLLCLAQVQGCGWSSSRHYPDVLRQLLAQTGSARPNQHVHFQKDGKRGQKANCCGPNLKPVKSVKL